VLGGHREGSADIASYSRLATAKRKAKADAFAQDMKESLDLLKAEGLTLQQMAEALNMGGPKTQRRFAWTASAARQVVLRLS
jgi:ATP-dependent DNA ligase